MPQPRKLTGQQVLDIRALIAAGENNYAISRQFRVHHESIWQIRTGRAYASIQTEADFTEWGIDEGLERSTVHLPLIHNIHDAYCGFKLSSYGLRKYGRKVISAIIDFIKICEHGNLCEDCCFLYKGPRKYYQFKKDYDNHLVWLPVAVTGFPLKTIEIFMFECVMGYTEEKVQFSCRNYYCTNPHHMTIFKGGRHGRTGQKAQSDD